MKHEVLEKTIFSVILFIKSLPSSCDWIRTLCSI